MPHLYSTWCGTPAPPASIRFPIRFPAISARWRTAHLPLVTCQRTSQDWRDIMESIGLFACFRAPLILWPGRLRPGRHPHPTAVRGFGRASLGEVVSEKDGGKSEDEAGGEVEGEKIPMPGAEEGGILVHEGRKGRESPSEAGGKEQAQARGEPSGPSGWPRHEAEQEASRHVHGEGCPRESRPASRRENLGHEKPGRSAHEAAAADEDNGKEGFHDGAGSGKRMPFSPANDKCRFATAPFPRDAAGSRQERLMLFCGLPDVSQPQGRAEARPSRGVRSGKGHGTMSSGHSISWTALENLSKIKLLVFRQVFGRAFFSLIGVVR